MNENAPTGPCRICCRPCKILWFTVRGNDEGRYTGLILVRGAALCRACEIHFNGI